MVQARGVACLAIVATLLVAGKLSAQTAWTGTDGTNWSDALDWTSGLPSTDGMTGNTVVNFNSAGNVSSFVDVNFSIVTLQVSSISGNVYITTSGGSIALSGAFNDQSTEGVYLYTPFTNSGSSVLNLEAAAPAGYMYLGGNTFNFGSVTVSQGSLNVASDAILNASTLDVGTASSLSGTIAIGGMVNVTGAASIGSSSGSTGTISGGEGSQFNAGTVIVGDAGNGILLLTNASASTGNDIIGNQGGSTGMVVLNNSTWDNFSLVIGHAGTGELELTEGGTLNTSGGLVTLGDTGGSGTLDIGATATGEQDTPGFFNGTTVSGGSLSGVQFNIENSSDNPYYFTPDGTSDTAAIVMEGAMQVVLTNGYLVLNAQSTYSGGTQVNGGTLALGSSTVGAPGSITSGPVGTGTLTMGNGTLLSIPEGANITLANQIFINDSDGGAAMNIGGYTTGMLTLSGNINDSDFTGGLLIGSPVTLSGDNSYYGGTSVTNTSLTVTSDHGVGYGSLTGDGAEITFTSAAPYIRNGQFTDDTTVTFTAVGGSPVFGELRLQNSTIIFADNSTPTIEGFDGDTIGDESTIQLGSGTALTFFDVPDPDYYGNITGAGSVTFNSTQGAEYNLYGFNSYTGGTSISGSAVLVAGSNSAFGASTGSVTVENGASIFMLSGVTISNPITVQAGGSIGGFGTYAPGVADTIHIGGGSIIGGGSGSLTLLAAEETPVGSVGTLAFDSNTTLSFDPNGLLQFSIMNATGTAGTDFSLITTAGALNLTANSMTAYFFIQPVSIDPGTGSPGIANFNNTSSYSWVLVSAAGGITGFDPAGFYVTNPYFQNDLGSGHFYVSQSGDDLMLNFTPVPEPSAWILMAGGVGAFGFAAWRRRQISAAA
jgi:fibronectin-binding autotransporter adhesin